MIIVIACYSRFFQQRILQTTRDLIWFCLLMGKETRAGTHRGVGLRSNIWPRPLWWKQRVRKIKAEWRMRFLVLVSSFGCFFCPLFDLQKKQKSEGPGIFLCYKMAICAVPIAFWWSIISSKSKIHHSNPNIQDWYIYGWTAYGASTRIGDFVLQNLSKDLSLVIKWGKGAQVFVCH